MHETELRLQQLTKADLQQLKVFSEARLARLGQSPLHAEDMVSKALNSVLRGLEPGQAGRRPRPDELVTPGDFMDFLRGAVCSTVEAYARRREFQHYHQPIDCLGTFEVATQLSPDAENELLDLKEVIFDRLRAVAPARLLPTVSRWEEVFLWSDTIPNVPNAKSAFDVRKMARQIMWDLGMAPGRHVPRI